MSKFDTYSRKEQNEKNEPAEEKQVCQKCGADIFRVYIRIIIDDARLYCAKCGEPFL